jgi:hypothetical protein
MLLKITYLIFSLFKHPSIGLLGIAALSVSCSHDYSQAKASITGGMENRNIGRTFTLKRAAYAHILEGVALSAPMLGTPLAEGNKFGSPRLPSPVSETRVGYRDGPVKIVGVLEPGTTLKIIDVIYHSSPTWHDIEIVFHTSSPKIPEVVYVVLALKGIKQVNEPDFGESPSFLDYYMTETTRR